jgi:hypothetical protein
MQAKAKGRKSVTPSLTVGVRQGSVLANPDRQGGGDTLFYFTLLHCGVAGYFLTSNAEGSRIWGLMIEDC